MTLDQPTLRWYVENKWWHNRRLELSTRATYDQRLRLYPLPRFGGQLLVNIACADIQAWLTELKEHKSLKPYYVAQCVLAVRSYLLTTRKHSQQAMEVLRELFTDGAWLPAVDRHAG